MRIITTAIAILLLLVAIAPSASAAAKPACLDENQYYCVFIQGDEVCVRAHLGDLEGPYTWCETLPGIDRAGLPGECTGTNDHYCWKVENGRVCITYDLGDLEGPYTTCVGTTRSASAGDVCTTDLFQAVGACVGSGCATVYVGPSGTPICPGVAAIEPICTLEYYNQVAVCQEANGCTTVWVSFTPIRVCPPL